MLSKITAEWSVCLKPLERREILQNQARRSVTLLHLFLDLNPILLFGITLHAPPLNIIYCISCSKSCKLYIGETGRRLSDRFAEHLQTMVLTSLSRDILIQCLMSTIQFRIWKFVPSSHPFRVVIQWLPQFLLCFVLTGCLISNFPQRGKISNFPLINIHEQTSNSQKNSK